MIINYIILGIFFPWLLGYILLSMEEKFSYVKYFLAFPLGIGLISYQLFFYSLAHLKFNLIFLFYPWILVLSYIVYKKKIKINIGLDVKKIRLDKLNAVFLVIILFWLVFVFSEALLKPNSSLDALSIWSFKGKAFFIDKAVSQEFFDMSREYSHFDYPLLVPLSQTWLALVLGKWDDTLIKIISPIFYLSFLGTFFCFLKPYINNKWLLMWTALLASFPILIKYSQIPIADTPFLFYLFVSVFLIYFIFFKEMKLHFIWPALFLSFLVWTKNEGLILSLLIIFLGMVNLLRNKKIKLSLLSVFGLLVCMNFPWFVYKVEMGFINSIISLDTIAQLSIGQIYYKIPVVAEYFTREMLLSGHWYGLWWIYLIIIFIFRRKIFNQPKEVLLDFINLSLFIYAGVFLLIPDNMGFYLTSTIDRLILHIVPVVLFFVILCISESEDLAEEVYI